MKNISKLEKIIGNDIDIENFSNGTDYDSKLDNGTRWNAGFHIKLQTKDPEGAKGIHAHVNDGWNHCDENIGWAAVVFLTPDHMSYENSGFDVWTK